MFMSNVEIDQIRPLSRDEYYQMFDAGIIEGERVELLRGLVVTMSPQSSRHMNAVVRMTRALILRLGDRADVRPQGPIAVSEHSEPEPDIAVTPHNDDPDAEHPSTALLVIEVSVSSLRKDTQVKPAIYAEAGVDEYWVVDLENDRVLVYAEPVDGRYRSERVATVDERLAVPGYPDVSLAVTEILPTR